jgi:hypothetical protein
LCQALYKQGISFRRLKKKKEAKLFLTDAAQKCADDAEVLAKVKKELKDLG